jgi:imidazolonepropionase-like amidohydrolase
MTRVVLHDAALADGTSGSLRTGMSVAIDGGQIVWIRPNDSADTTGAEVVDAGGATIVPAMVDCHSHLTMQGGSHWIARGAIRLRCCDRSRATTRGASHKQASCGRATSARR